MPACHENEQATARSLVIQHSLTLYSRDQHFDHVPEIPRA
jgi:hypothetical protein